MWGAGGGATAVHSDRGGVSAQVSGTIPIGPGEILQIIVGEGGKPLLVGDQDKRAVNI